MNQRTLTLELERLSTTIADDYDTLKIIFIDPSLFIAETNSSWRIDTDTQLTYPLPYVSSESEKYIERIGQELNPILTSVLQTTLLATLSLSFLFQLSLQPLWALINVMQLITHFPLFNVPQFPLNAVVFYKIILDIANMRILPDIIPELYPGVENEGGEIEWENFIEMGYESAETFSNIKGGILQTIELYVIGIIITLGIRMVKSISMVAKIQSKLIETLVYSFILRAIIENFLENAVYIMLGLLKFSSITTIDKVSTLALTIASFGFLLWVCHKLYWLKTSTLTEIYSRKFGSLYEQLNIQKHSAKLYTPLFLLRRALIAFLAVAIHDIPSLQIQILVFHSFLMFIYLLLTKPFTSKRLYYIELFNEGTVYIASMHLFIFTDFGPSADVQYAMGWSLIGITLLNIVVNIFVVWVDNIQCMREKSLWVVKRVKSCMQADKVVKLKPSAEISRQPSFQQAQTFEGLFQQSSPQRFPEIEIEPQSSNKKKVIQIQNERPKFTMDRAKFTGGIKREV
ncbi:hypothetical protein FGO68_gene4317 [Halteria grandinella]|uniref:TRP C-terminal domain-containing protein n=1 Tax=Halteria grandinella TaxID=5974 RepID=A0A8J8P1Y5_HALGN|nr:hypothetical protein FGO68_gene4317 [Halteria grandinella]